MSSVSNGLHFLTLPLVSVMSVIYRKIRHARYLYIKRNVEKVWGARHTLGARYLSKNTVIILNRSVLSTKCTILTLNKGLKLHIPVIHLGANSQVIIFGFVQRNLCKKGLIHGPSQVNSF